jgi:phosphoenolpyruvate carboxykinase (GTP)
VPSDDGLDLEGLDIDAEAVSELLHVEPEEWKAQLPQVREHFARFGGDLPEALRAQLARLEERLGGSESA